MTLTLAQTSRDKINNLDKKGLENCIMVYIDKSIAKDSLIKSTHIRLILKF